MVENYLNSNSYLIKESDYYQNCLDKSNKYFGKINFHIIEFTGNRIIENLTMFQLKIKDKENNILKKANVFFDDLQILFVQIK